MRLLRRLVDEFRDQLLIVGPLVAVIALSNWLELTERVEALARANEHWQLDEFVMAFCLAGVFYMAMLVRRTRRLRRELGLKRNAQSEADALAHRDSLTGLANRRVLIGHIQSLIDDAEPGAMISVLALDLDRFKPINDTYGHEGGDTALKAIATRLERIVEGHGLAARMGGDEFACAIAHPAGSDDPTELAESLLLAISNPVQLRGGFAEVTASIGIKTCPAGKRTPEEMLRAADFAMYRAKQAGRSRYCTFVPQMDREMRERAQLELDMHAGVTRGEFLPFYQPIVALHSGEVMGFEALARWQHPSRGLVGPDLFIPIAEDAGMIQDLGFAVLRRACAEARDWPQHLTLSVNISPLQLNDPWLAQRILQVLCATGFPARRLIVEVTENRLVEDIEAARGILLSLKSAGIQIALDDFGTGYASLKHLRELQFNRIKIDRNFVQNIGAAENGEIVRAIMSLSAGLGLPVTAEGVETDESAQLLAGLGCEYGQGYLYSRPVEGVRALAIANEAHFAPGPRCPSVTQMPTMFEAPRRFGT